MKKYVIVVAGGSGIRMGSEVPKQFLLVGDRPVLMHTLNVFYEALPDFHLILVIPEEHFSFWESLCLKYNYIKPFLLVKGGTSRYQSVKNGLVLVPEDALVAIHDGVRPFPGIEMIQRVFKHAEENGNAIPVMPLNDSIRKIEGTENMAVDRSLYRLVQTPQCFHAKLLKDCYQKTTTDAFTDDASVLDAFGIKINFIDGENGNIKITRKEDLSYAEFLLSAKK